jgi:hypothetical protein
VVGAHQRNGVAAVPWRKLGGGRCAPAAQVDEWCHRGMREMSRCSGSVDSWWRKYAAGRSAAAMPKQREKQGSKLGQLSGVLKRRRRGSGQVDAQDSRGCGPWRQWCYSGRGAAMQ